MQYARSLNPDELRAVHVAVDVQAAEQLMEKWLQLGLSRFPLELVDCPDRRIVRSVVEVVSEALADGRTEVTVLVPRREYRRFWHRLLHDHTGDAIAKGLAALRSTPTSRSCRISSVRIESRWACDERTGRR